MTISSNGTLPTSKCDSVTVGAANEQSKIPEEKVPCHPMKFVTFVAATEHSKILPVNGTLPTRKCDFVTIGAADKHGEMFNESTLPPSK